MSITGTSTFRDQCERDRRPRWHGRHAGLQAWAGGRRHGRRHHPVADRHDDQCLRNIGDRRPALFGRRHRRRRRRWHVRQRRWRCRRCRRCGADRQRGRTIITVSSGGPAVYLQSIGGDGGNGKGGHRRWRRCGCWRRGRCPRSAPRNPGSFALTTGGGTNAHGFNPTARAARAAMAETATPAKGGAGGGRTGRQHHGRHCDGLWQPPIDHRGSVARSLRRQQGGLWRHRRHRRDIREWRQRRAGGGGRHALRRRNLDGHHFGRAVPTASRPTARSSGGAGGNGGWFSGGGSGRHRGRRVHHGRCSGSITTLGAGSFGIVAQSVAGHAASAGGGVAIVTRGHTAAVPVRGAITVTNAANITTVSDQAMAVVVQSVGGGAVTAAAPSALLFGWLGRSGRRWRQPHGRQLGQPHDIRDRRDRHHGLQRGEAVADPADSR